MTSALWLTLNPETEPRCCWDMTLLADLFGALRLEQEECACGNHYDPRGGVVVVAGQHNQTVEQIERVCQIVEKMAWSLTIVTSDEEALFPLSALPTGDRRRTWTQYRQNPDADRLIPIGYPPGLRVWAKRYASMTGRQHQVDFRYFFAGQDTHERRHELIRTMKHLPSAVCLPSPTFLGGLDQHSYWKAMCSAQVCPAPSGLVSVDSFRLYEALELGRIPVIETQSPYENQAGFWPDLFGYSHPLPIVDEWEELAELCLPWPQLGVECQAWWTGQKRALARDLTATIKELAG